MLLLLIGTGQAAGGPCAPDIAEFRTVVDLTSASSGTVDESYRFSLPSGCAKVSLPRVMDGMSVVGFDAVVSNGEIALGESWSVPVLVVTRRRVLRGGPFAAAVQPPGFPVASMVVEITSPLSTRLSVWTDPTATVQVRRDRIRRYRASFSGGGLLVWSSQKDWWAVGDQVEAIVGRKVAPPRSLGELGAGAETLTIGEIARKVAVAIALESVGPGLADAADAGEVVRRGRGTAAERALVLVSVLRAAGWDAKVALLRPSGAEPISLSVPGLELFPDVAVYVEGGDGQPIWLDPASSNSETAFVPPDLRGSIVLVPGDYPRRLHDHAYPDGTIRIESTGTIKDNGALEVTASVTAEGAATQAIRDVLGQFTKDVRKQWLNDLLVYARPDVTKLRFQLYGVDDPQFPFGMTLEFKEPKTARPIGEGLKVEVPPLLAPQLARVLPPNIEVHETLVLDGTGEMAPYGVLPVEERSDPDAIITRRADVVKGTARLSTTVLRPWRTNPREEQSRVRLYEAAARGPEVVLFGKIDRTTARKIRSEQNNTQTKVLEALLWFEAGEPLEAEKALKRAVRSGRLPTLLDVLRRYTPLGEYRPWNVVWSALPDDHARLAMVRELELKHERREAWRRATELVESPVDEVRVEALITVARVQGDRPAANIDEKAHKAWREPSLLVARAESIAEEVWGARGHPAVDVPVAQQLIQRDKCEDAGPRIQRVLDTTTNARIRSVHAEYRACLGDRDVLPLLDGIVADADYDPVVIATIVRAYQRLGRVGEARRWSMLAAQIAGTDVQLWMDASQASLEAGDLPSAVYAMRRASDLGTTSMNTSVPLQILATLAGDAEQAEVASRRSSYSASVEPIPVSMENALTFITEPQRLGFLRVRDLDVLGNQELLEERAQRHLALGDELGAVRDAAWLTTTYRSRLADAYAYVATSEGLWSTNAGEELGRSVRDPEVRRLRLEHGLITGSVDPVADARQLADDAGAGVVLQAVDRPEDLRMAMGWPEVQWKPEATVPEGFRESTLLGAMPGVRGFVNREAGASLLVTSVDGRLPPPFEGVFTLGPVVDTFGRVTVHSLDGGGARAYVATRKVGDLTWWGVARSRQLARFAVDAGIAAQSAP